MKQGAVTRDVSGLVSVPSVCSLPATLMIHLSTLLYDTCKTPPPCGFMRTQAQDILSITGTMELELF